MIRRETPLDADAIGDVVAAAFREAAHASHTEQSVVRALRDSGQLAVSLVAQQEGAVIGHVAVSPVAVSDGTPGWYGLGPVSVQPRSQGQGIGTLLVEGALSELRALGVAGCVVLGDPGFYARFGFRPEPGLLLPGVPAGYFQALAFNGAMASGEVTYADAFEAAG